MKRFSSLVVVKSPPDQLCAMMRDRLPQLAESLKDVEKIDELERSQLPGSVLVINRWHAREPVPSFLRARLGASTITWIDRAQWLDDGRQCRWTIEPSIGDGAITCSGATTFVPAMAGRGTRATFEGQLDIAPAFLSSLVGPFQAPVKALVESIATTLIPSNFRAVAEAASKALRSSD